MECVMMTSATIMPIHGQFSFKCWRERQCLKPGSGTIEFDEFLSMMSKNKSRDPEKELLDVFHVFDQNGDGHIDADELYDVLTKIGEVITKAEVREMIQEADVDGDGTVNFTEFKRILTAK
ncbi:calmodulin-like [Lingula anatina]|uniref:Calmodulin-like n=1 Tax=Lingula anatina TaxID=7574 RepID=A0A1S3IWZ7_LINAN|nr:calmodulin-like [Lingula anatina]|eukprot:XP_013402069.1 calmodulin-like [Lingula anatina]